MPHLQQMQRQSANMPDRFRIAIRYVTPKLLSAGDTAFVVEFGPRVQARSTIGRHARAVIRLARRMS